MVQFQQETRSSIQNLEKKVSQISGMVSRIEAKDSGKVPSETELNLREQVYAITFISEKKIPKTVL